LLSSATSATTCGTNAQEQEEDVMPPDLVKSLDEVRASIRQFNADLERSAELAARLKMNRAWYYDPELDMIGPSKFIGYAGMTAERYLQEGAADGKQTEPVLKRWFRLLDNDSPEAAFVRSRAESLVAKHGKSLSEVARFCAPIGWKVTGKEPLVRPGIHATRGRRTIHATIIKGETHYVAECEQLAVVTQGVTIDETIQNLREAVELHLEGEDLAALGLAPDPVIMVSMELQPWAA
jgi:predicted RNase H-like HicB family nuclease